MNTTHKQFLFIPLCLCCLGLFGGIIGCSHSPKVDAEAYTDAHMQQTDSLLLNKDGAAQRKVLRDILIRDKDSIYYYHDLMKYGFTFYYQPDSTSLDSIASYFNKCRRFFERQKPDDRVNLCLLDNYHRAYIAYTQYALTDSMMLYANLSYQQALRCRVGSKLMKYSLNVGDAYNYIGDFSKSFYWYHRAMFQADSMKLSEPEKLPVYNTFLRIYLSMKDFDMARRYVNLVGRQYPQLSNFDKYYYLNSAGMFHYYQKDYPRSLKQYRTMYQLVKHNPEAFNLSERNTCMLNLADVFTEMGQMDSARFYIAPAIQTFTRAQWPAYYYYTNNVLTRMAIHEGDRVREQALLKEVENNKEAPLFLQREWYKYMYEQSKGMAHYADALRYKEEYDRLSSLIQNDEIKQKTAEMRVRYEQDTIHLHEVVRRGELESEVTYAHMIGYFWIGICVVILLIAWIVYFRIRHRQRVKDAHMMNQIVDLRMESIRNRISPHFLMNALSHLLHKEQSDGRDLHSLVMLLRRNLVLVNETIVSLHDELDFIRLYVGIERGSLLDDDFDMHIEVDAHINPERLMLPSMMVQIFVENAMKHGLRGREGYKYLGIEAVKEADSTRIEVTDNGGGFKHVSDSSLTSTGTGFKVITQTIHLLNQRNKREIRFTIANKPCILKGETYTCCVVSLVIPDGFKF